MKYLTSQQIRDIWLNFFKSKGHMIEPGASLIPVNDPSLLWINAGVAALKKYFDGTKIPDSKRITNIQKCIRTNDIDNVGRTARHHTFFEMVGNFSIGDYFRDEVLPWAYELLTSEKYFGIPNEKLYITYYPDDLVTKSLWIKCGMAEDHMIPIKDNFWQIGEGPCGPDTEIFFDRGEKYDPNHIGIKLLADDIENDRYIEIWNIVFSQYNAVNGVERKDYKELPHKNIDTGGGLERFACIMQGTDTNFETDLFMPYIKKINELCKVPYEGENLMAYRVIADHIRSCTFALADGENFSNEGRGYVLRRLLRRACKYAQKLGLHEPFMYKIVPTVVENMKSFYPYLIEKEDYVSKMIKNEEEKFIKTLSKGEAILSSLIEGKDSLSGQDAFKMYDTYGFPIELTEEICEENHVKVDLKGFEDCLKAAKELARNSRKNIDSFAKQSADLLDFKKESHYTYLDDDVTTTVIGLFKDGVKVDSIDETGEVVFETTNFYAEMGGEIADTGVVENESFRANVINVGKTPNGCHLHKIEVLYGTLKEGETVTLKVDHIKHLNTMKNHSATHLMQSALINVLGDDIKQKGSFVCSDYLRFDFNYQNKIRSEDLKKVERLVNEYINAAIQRETKVLPIAEANKLGAISEFNEKYGDTVRVVCFGDISKEFCGGCHVDNTKDIGCFVIKSEGAISSGIRRIEAYTGLKAYEEFKDRNDILDIVRDDLGSKSYVEIESRLKAKNNEFNELNEKYNELNAKLTALTTQSLLGEVKEINGMHVLIKYVKDMDMRNLMSLVDSVKSRFNDYLIIAIGQDGEKLPLIISSSKVAIDKGYSAKNVIKQVNGILGGNGGGKDETAKGSVNSLENISNIAKELKL